jgi:nucleoid DNA-binding protein
MGSKKIQLMSASQEDFIYGIVHQEGLSESQARKVIQLLISQIELALYAGATVQLPRLGKLYVRYIPERKGIHPRYRNDILIKSSLRVCFEQAQSLKSELEKKIELFEEILEEPAGGKGKEKSKRKFQSLFQAQYGQPVTKNKADRERAENAPNIVRSSFLQYLRTHFVYGLPWKHPVTGTEFDKDQVVQRLKEYSSLDPSGYKVLWYIWTTQKSRVFIADALSLSTSTVKRRQNKAADTVLLMLLLPELKPENFELFKQSL